MFYVPAASAHRVTTPPIPPAIWQRITEFLASGRPGRIVLDVVHGGKIVGYEIVERGRERDGVIDSH